MITAYLFLVAVYGLAFSTEGISQTKLGKTRAEIEKLAVKEGAVSIGGSFGRDKWLFEGFTRKFPSIKVEASYTSGAGTQERVLSEALAGVVQYDVFDVGAPMQENFMKAGVIAGPIEWRKLFPDVPEVHFSPGGHFVADRLQSARLCLQSFFGAAGSCTKRLGGLSRSVLERKTGGRFAAQAFERPIQGLGRKTSLEVCRRFEKQPADLG